MNCIQLKLFKDFTTADERNDIHTSAVAMLRDYVEQMDLQSIRLMMSEQSVIADMDSAVFFEKLELAFVNMRMSGNFFLDSAEGVCNRCHPGVAAFVFRGTNIPWHLSFLFHVKDDKVTDMHECMLMWKQFPELQWDFQYLLRRDNQVFSNSHEDYEGYDDPPF